MYLYDRNFHVGLTDKQMEAILSEHSNDVDVLESKLSQQYQQQDEALKVSTDITQYIHTT